MKKEGTNLPAGDNSTHNISVLFEDSLQTDVFNARCHDTGDSSTRKFNIFYHVFFILLT